MVVSSWAGSKVAEVLLIRIIGESVAEKSLELNRDSNLRGWLRGDGISGANVVVTWSRGVVEVRARDVNPRPRWI